MEGIQFRGPGSVPHCWTKQLLVLCCTGTLAETAAQPQPERTPDLRNWQRPPLWLLSPALCTGNRGALC